MAKRIAIVNNDRNLPEIFALWLREAGLEVTLYEKGVDALAPLRANPPDLILLDQTNTPYGTELFAQLNETWVAPVVFVTPHAEDVQRTLGRPGTPAADYISTPLSMQKFVDRITRLLDP
jgi:DNA-binding response OmpR family regulator